MKTVINLVLQSIRRALARAADSAWWDAYDVDHSWAAVYLRRAEEAEATVARLRVQLMASEEQGNDAVTALGLARQTIRMLEEKVNVLQKQASGDGPELFARTDFRHSSVSGPFLRIPVVGHDAQDTISRLRADNRRLMEDVGMLAREHAEEQQRASQAEHALAIATAQTGPVHEAYLAEHAEVMRLRAEVIAALEALRREQDAHAVDLDERSTIILDDKARMIPVEEINSALHEALIKAEATAARLRGLLRGILDADKLDTRIPFWAAIDAARAEFEKGGGE